MMLVVVLVVMVGMAYFASRETAPAIEVEQESVRLGPASGTAEWSEAWGLLKALFSIGLTVFWYVALSFGSLYVLIRFIKWAWSD